MSSQDCIGRNWWIFIRCSPVIGVESSQQWDKEDKLQIKHFVALSAENLWSEENELLIRTKFEVCTTSLIMYKIATIDFNNLLLKVEGQIIRTLSYLDEKLAICNLRLTGRETARLAHVSYMLRNYRPDHDIVFDLTRSRCFIKHFFVAVQYLRVFEFFKF